MKSIREGKGGERERGREGEKDCYLQKASTRHRWLIFSPENNEKVLQKCIKTLELKNTIKRNWTKVKTRY
jgi:hypothetical protein